MESQRFDLSGEVKIIIPDLKDMNDVKKEIIQSADCIKTHLEYPNGLILDFEQVAGKISLHCNKKIIKNDDGTFTFEI